MNTVLKWVALGALFIIPFLPLYVDGSLFFPFISSKGFAFRILVEIAAASWLLLALSDKAYRPKFSWTLVIYAGLVAWMFLANLVAVNPDKAFWSNFERMDGWVSLIHVFLFFVVLSSMLSAEKRWRAWWLTVLAASVLVVGHGFLQLLCAGQACAASFPIHQGGVRVDANIGNAAYLASYLLFTIAVSVWQAVVSKGTLRYLLLLLAGLGTIILFFTATRGAILGFVAAAFAGSLLWLWLAGKGARKVGYAALSVVVVLTVGFLLVKDAEFVRQDPILGRIASISLEAAETRLTLWGMALKGAAERPVLGWGQEGYLFIFSEYYEPSLYAQEPWFDRAHNVYIDWLVAGGIPALLLFLALLTNALVALFRSPLPRIERVMLIAALVAYAFQALVVFDNLLTYIFLAAILAIAHDTAGRPWRALDRLPEVKGMMLSGVALPVVVVVTVTAIWIVNVNNLLAGKTLIRAAISSQPEVSVEAFKDALSKNSFATQEIREQLITYAANLSRGQNIPDSIKQEVFILALTEMEKQVQKVPSDTRVLLQYAQGLASAGDFDGAIVQIERAEALSPERQLLLLQKGMVLWQAGKLEAAREAFLKAYAITPEYTDAALYAAIGHIITGESKQAKELLFGAFGTTTVDNDFLRVAYYDAKLYDELIESSRLRVADSPEDYIARFRLAQAYAEAGRRGEAKATIEETARLFPDQTALAAELIRQLGL